MIENLFAFYPTLLLLHCAFIVSFNNWLGPVGTFYGALMLLGFSLFVNLNELTHLLTQGHYYYVDFGRWFSCLDLIDSHLVFCVDTLALTSAALVLTLTTFALYFGSEYMFSEAFINRLLYLLNLFATSVVILFFCYDYFLIMLAWECIGLFSLLLVNFYSTRVYTINAAQNTFVFSSISDMFMFISFLLTIVVFNSTDLSVIFLQIPFMAFHFFFVGSYSYHFLTVFSMALVLSGGVNAAQFFSHVWLPDAMEAPTPASALIHSSTLVVAGVFLIIRFSILFEFTLFTNYFLTLLGALTLAFGAITAIFQTDVNNLVAYSTISQIGYLICGCGFCCYEEVFIYLIVHALNNAFLFVLVGYIVHFFSGNTDMRQMGGAYPYSFDMSVLLLGVCFNLAGLPYSAGFLGNEFLLFHVLNDDFLALFVSGCWMVSFFFTPIYMFILVFNVMFGTNRGAISAYSFAWEPVLHYNWTALSVRWVGSEETWVRLNHNYGFRFQQTAVTARPTVILLLLFWSFFFFFGESLLLITFNYNTLTDFIPSSSFATLKSHLPFKTNLGSASLNDTIFFFIIFASTSSFYFLANLRYTFTYFPLRSSLYLEVLVVLVLLYLFGGGNPLTVLAGLIYS